MSCSRIVIVTDTWNGANGLGLARGFRSLGCVTKQIDPSAHFGQWQSRKLRLVRRALRSAIATDLAQRIDAEVASFEPDLVVVYKGSLVPPAVVAAATRRSIPVVLVFPDVSFTVHGPYIPEALPLYDWVFTTKSFGVDDGRRITKKSNLSVLPHGYDSAVHRPMVLSEADRIRYGCDVSFIGTWSPKKEAVLARLAADRPELSVRIWGAQWDSATSSFPSRCVQGRGVTGDEYACAIAGSTVNLGILSERRAGASSGDMVTSRTFHIPAVGGLLLHEWSDEVVRYFDDGHEILTYRDLGELCDKVDWVLSHAEDAANVASMAHERCLADYSLTHRADQLLEVLRAEGVLR